MSLKDAILAAVASEAYIAAARPAASNFNGAIGTIDITAPQSFINENYKIVLNAGQQYDLKATVVYGIASILKEEEVTAGDGITEEIMADIIKLAGIRYAQHELLALASRSDSGDETFVVSYRANDVVRHAALDPLFEGESPHFSAPQQLCTNLADVINTMVSENTIPEISQSAQYTTVTVVVNAFHRFHASGHNFFSGSLNDKNTITSRCPAFMGADKQNYTAFLRTYGHDLWHFLTTESIDILARIMVGDKPSTIHLNVHYNGQNVENELVHNVLKLAESVTDRYPPGTLGVSSLVLGMDSIAAMFSAIMMKSSIIEGSKVASACAKLKYVLANRNLDRGDLAEMRSNFGPIIATALGYQSYSRRGRETVDSHKSFAQFLSNHGADFASGNTLAEVVATLDVDPNAAKAAIESLTRRFADSIREYNTAAATAGADPVPADSVIDSTAIEVEVMSTKEVGKRREANLEAAENIANSVTGLNKRDLDYF